MSEENSAEIPPDPRLDSLLSEYLEALESGQELSVESWIRRYPEFADELRDFAANNQRLNAIVPRIPDVGQWDNNANTILRGDVTPNPAVSLADRLKYFGDYELIEEIARGGMGVVYRGRQVSLNRPVAVKMILAGELATVEDIARFRLEAEAAANLDHPGIVPIFEIGEREGRHYFSMKFIAGRSLAQRLRDRMAAESESGRKTLSSEEIRDAVRLVAAISRAVHYAHQRGIIHRDLKPANILIDEYGAPHITDFGLAKRIMGDSNLTHSGAIVGTPSYMAPEQAHGQGRVVTTAADIYGLGAILYAMLSNRPPFEGDSPLQTLLKVQNEAPERLNHLCPAVDRDLEAICDKCLAKDPDERYRSAGELGDDLDRWLNGEPILAAPPSLVGVFWHWLSTNFRTAASVVLLGLITGFLVADVFRGNLAHNVGNYLPIYQHSFPQLEPPWMLTAIAGYPYWLHFILVPAGVVCFLSMGWLTDRLVHPTNSATAVLAGMGLGTMAALTAFVSGIGWTFMIQVALWPAEPDLELLAGAVEGQASFVDGRKLQDVYPSVPARQVLKKAVADIQARVPLGLGYGILFSAGMLFLPATMQAWAAYLLRRRGDSRRRQLAHLLELSIPISMLLIGWGGILMERPGLASSFVILPLFGCLLIQRCRRWSVPARRILLVGICMAGAAIVGVYAELLFSPATGGGLSIGLFIVGAAAATLAVFQRWPWWGRCVVYATWLATLVYSGGVGGTFDAQVNHQRMLASLVGSSVVVLLTGVIAWWSATQAPQRRTLTSPNTSY